MATLTKIGKYEVVDTIGRGGMGVVYQAKDPYLDRLVAIKMMTVDVHENADFLERFYREAKSTASLRHPNIVTVYDLGEFQGRPFLVMEYLEGHSLESLLRAHRPMALLEKINIIIEVCQGLGYAHQHGIIHRDIKPGNIMVLNDGSVKIVDFGIARLGDNTLTRTGQIVGSLYYMPPEQLRDKPVDTRADIYSAGVVLYQLLTFALPFEGENTGSTLAKIISEDPPPPFRQFGLSCPPELEALTLKALAKNRDHRFPTAEALAMALGEVQDRLKQESIKEYLTKAELLQQSNELQQAQAYLLKVLKLDRQNTLAARHLSTVRAKLQAQLSAERVRQLKHQAEEAYEHDEFDAALSCMSQAIELDSNPELQAFRTTIEQAKAEAELVRKAIARAEAAQRSGDLDSAKNAIDSAFSHRPNDSKIKVLRRAIERDLEERERQRHVEGLLDEARKQMGGRRFTAALDLLREAQKLDPNAPQLRVLLERLATEHQQEKQRRELEQLTREVQDAMDRDDYKAASGKAAEGLGKYPHQTGLARLKELADAQIEIAANKEFVRNQTAAVQQLLDSGQTQRALDTVEEALQTVPENARLESLRTMIRDHMAKERTEADKATCLRQANDAISLGRYPDAIQILEGAQARFVDSKDVDDLLRFAREQQAKQRQRAYVEEAMRAAQRLLVEQDFEGAVKLLEKAVQQASSEDLDLLLLQSREQREVFRRDVQAAIARGKGLLEEGAITRAREFLASRPASYQQSAEFCDLVQQAETTAIPAVHPDGSESEATQVFSKVGPPPDAPTIIERESAAPMMAPMPVARGSATIAREPTVSISPRVAPEPVFEEPLAPSASRNPLVIGGLAAALVVIGLIMWLLMPGKPKDAYLNVQSNPGAHVFIDDKDSGTVAPDETLRVKVTPGPHRVRVSLDGYGTKTQDITIKPDETLPMPAELAAVASTPPPTPPPSPGTKLGTLIVQSNVAGADVFIDRQLKGITGRDAKLELQLEPGKYRLQVKKASYQDSTEQRIEIAANKEKPVTINMNKSSEGTTPPPATDAYLIVQSLPGAEVRVDGTASGKVSSGGTLSVKVNPGTRQVQVSLDGYDSWSSSETLAAGDRKGIEAVLRAKVIAKPVETPKPAATGTFTASVAEIDEGQSAQLTWNTRNADEVTIEPEASGLGPKGAIKVSPAKTTTYTLIAKGPGGDYRATAEIVVRARKMTEAAPVPSSSSADAEAIKELLYKFSVAYGDCGELMALWPSLTTSQCKAIEESTKKLKQTRLKDNCPGSPSISGEGAEWTCTETVTYVDGTERKSTKPTQIAFHFKKKNGTWYVDSHSVK